MRVCQFGAISYSASSKKALDPMMAQVQEEKPSVAEKLKMLEIDSIDKLPINLKKF
jgi:hypothetical protein